MNEQFDLRELRNAFGTFMTGVTVVTTREQSSTPRGFTANSFCSVSLDPPMLSVCIGKSADSADVFDKADGFAINILSEHQKELSGLFASKRPDKFKVAAWHDGPLGHPILENVCAWFDCAVEKRIDAGDHVMMIGRIHGFGYDDQNGLGYVRGGYVTLGLEQAAVNAAAKTSGVVVGALVECNGKLLLEEDPETRRFQPVASGLDYRQGSIGRLKDRLDRLGLGASVHSLFAVFESEDNERHYIYYRAHAEREGNAQTFFSRDEIPWDDLESEAIRTMLKRYLAESRSQRYGIYFGSEQSGTIEQTISDEES